MYPSNQKRNSVVVNDKELPYAQLYGEKKSHSFTGGAGGGAGGGVVGERVSMGGSGEEEDRSSVLVEDEKIRRSVSIKYRQACVNKSYNNQPKYSIKIHSPPPHSTKYRTTKNKKNALKSKLDIILRPSPPKTDAQTSYHSYVFQIFGNFGKK